MNLKEYRRLARTTRKNLLMDRMDDLHMILGLMTEIGEVADIFKKQIAYGVEPDWVNVQEEIGDFLWYVVNFCDLHNFDLEKILDMNIAKLATRYPNQFTEYNATQRDLEKEKNVLKGYSQLDFFNLHLTGDKMEDYWPPGQMPNWETKENEGSV